MLAATSTCANGSEQVAIGSDDADIAGPVLGVEEAAVGRKGHGVDVRRRSDNLRAQAEGVWLFFFVSGTPPQASAATRWKRGRHEYEAM
jgi:hypothetical protein